MDRYELYKDRGKGNWGKQREQESEEAETERSGEEEYWVNKEEESLPAYIVEECSHVKH